jgi:hypothetical protein
MMMPDGNINGPELSVFFVRVWYIQFTKWEDGKQNVEFNLFKYLHNTMMLVLVICMYCMWLIRTIVYSYKYSILPLT